MTLDQGGKTAILYRMVMPENLWPYGLKSKGLLEWQGSNDEDRHLETRGETEPFKKAHDVGTTPQTFSGGARIGGHDAPRAHFGQKVKDEGETCYHPVIAIFAVAVLMAPAVGWYALGTVSRNRAFEWFIAISMCLLAVRKAQDVESFSTMFQNYDLLARRRVRYGYVYPFGEARAGILKIAGALIRIAVSVALFIGTVGAVPVFKAVCTDKREPKCACVGGSSNAPLGFVSLTEKRMMIAMGIWMPARMLWLEWTGTQMPAGRGSAGGASMKGDAEWH